eukprot:s1651_g4.t1
MFLPIMFLGYAGFGNEAPENLVDSMRDSRPMGWWALNRAWETGRLTATGACLALIVQLAMISTGGGDWTVNMLMTEAIIIPCAVLAVEASFPGVFRRGPRWARKVMRLGIAFFRLVVATQIESFVAMSALVTALFCTSLAGRSKTCICNNIVLALDDIGLVFLFGPSPRSGAQRISEIFPIVAFHYCKVKKVGPVRKTIHVLVLLYGVFIMIFGSIAAMQSLSPADEKPGTRVRSDLTPQCRSAFDALNITADDKATKKAGFFKGLMQDQAAHKIFPVFWLVCVSLAVFQYIMDIRKASYEVAPTTSFMFEMLVPVTLAVFTFVALGDPGKVPSRPQGNSGVEELMKALDTDAADIDPPDVNRLCTTTWVLKGLRTKYCVQTGACVEEFDHYCVWLNNTIGKANHRQFVGLAIVEFLTQVMHIRLCLLMATTLVPYTSFGQFIWGVLTGYPLLTLIVLVHCITAPWVFMLTLHQARLVMMNLTTNEMMNMHRYEHFWVVRQMATGHAHKSFRNPFNKGSAWKNCLDFWWYRRRGEVVEQRMECCSHGSCHSH